MLHGAPPEQDVTHYKELSETVFVHFDMYSLDLIYCREGQQLKFKILVSLKNVKGHPSLVCVYKVATSPVRLKADAFLRHQH